MINPKELDRYNEKKVFSARNYFLLSGILINLSGKVSIRHYRYKGYGLVWTSIFLMLIILLIGLSIDTAKISLVYHQMQNAADAAALAGANQVKVDQDFARQQAQDIANANIKTQNDLNPGSDYYLDLNVDNDPYGDIVIGWFNRQLGTFDPAVYDTDPVNAMAVISTRSTAKSDLGGPIGMIFGVIAGVPTVNIAGTWQSQHRPYAIAMCAGGTGAGLIALDLVGRGLDLRGNVTLDITSIPPAVPPDGEIQINSGDEDAFHVDGGPTIESTAVNVHGGVDIGNYDIQVPYNTPSDPVPDPLGGVPEPTVDVSTDRSFDPEILAMDGDGPSVNGIYINDYNHPIEDPNINLTWELYPGYYSEGFVIQQNAIDEQPVVHFNPGIYIIGGDNGEGSNRPSGIVLNAQSYITSDEAMFFITHNINNIDQSDYGVVDIPAGSGFKATEPTGETLESLGFSDVYEGITIFQDRDNTNPAFIGGGGNLDLDGTLYFPNALVELYGGGGGFGNQLIAGSFYVHGNGEIRIEYDGRNKGKPSRAFLIR